MVVAHTGVRNELWTDSVLAGDRHACEVAPWHLYGRGCRTCRGAAAIEPRDLASLNSILGRRQPEEADVTLLHRHSSPDGDASVIGRLAGCTRRRAVSRRARSAR